MTKDAIDNLCDGSTNINNEEFDFTNGGFESTNTDLDIQNDGITKFCSDKGAFSGDDPYVISGIPTGTVIEDLIVPASAHEGEKLNITIKLGVSR